VKPLQDQPPRPAPPPRLPRPLDRTAHRSPQQRRPADTRQTPRPPGAPDGDGPRISGVGLSETGPKTDPTLWGRAIIRAKSNAWCLSPLRRATCGGTCGSPSARRSLRSCCALSAQHVKDAAACFESKAGATPALAPTLPASRPFQASNEPRMRAQRAQAEARLAMRNAGHCSGRESVRTPGSPYLLRGVRTYSEQLPDAPAGGRPSGPGSRRWVESGQPSARGIWDFQKEAPSLAMARRMR
jgi:hypothetical protein